MKNSPTISLSLALLSLFYSVSVGYEFIHIRGHDRLQKLPVTLTKSWKLWTFDSLTEQLDPVETLYLPADLPPPSLKPALGVGISNGVARYLMPSLVLSLETPDKIWRNRGILSLPRAWAWIDLYSEFAPQLKDLRLSCFASNGETVRFLEDLDGSSSWNCLFTGNNNENYKDVELPVQSAFQQFQAFFSQSSGLQKELREGFHFVDIPIPELPFPEMKLSKQKIYSYLSNFDDPRRLLSMSFDDELKGQLDQESCAELSLQSVAVGRGGDSPYLPQVYRDLYEPGNVIET
eukprot:gene5115-5478_t